MSTSAWIMMLCTWAVAIFFVVKLFIKVLRLPLDQKRSLKDN